MSTTPITAAHLQFKPLAHATFIDNAVVPINNHFQLSISKNRSPGMWYVGDDDSYEVAIQAFEPGNPTRCLVWVGNDNVTRDCDLADINRLADHARTLIYVGRIEVFDCGEGDKEPRWLTRFCCAAGKDFEEKTKYAQRVWSEMRHRFIPYVK